MTTQSRTRILCVDDEPNVLEGLKRVLHRSYEVVTAAGSERALRVLRQDGQFAAIVSDLRMPRIDGIGFLEEARKIRPDAVRVLLTGHADLSSALDAVNRGAIFRFLIKPSSPEVIEQAVAAAVEQHRLIVAERVLLEQTLYGSIRALTDVLALTNPAGFGRAARVKALVGDLAASIGAEGRWQIEVAAMLSQIGTVTLPVETVDKLYGGKPLTYAEAVCVERLPQIACDLLGSIPRLEEVREILRLQNARFDGSRKPRGTPAGGQIPLGARLLKLVLDFDLLETQGLSSEEAIETLHGRTGWYDPDLLAVLARRCEESATQERVLELELRAVQPGMVFVEDVVTSSGHLLVARGHPASERLTSRIRNLAHLEEARQRVRVTVPAARVDSFSRAESVAQS